MSVCEQSISASKLWAVKLSWLEDIHSRPLFGGFWEFDPWSRPDRAVSTVRLRVMQRTVLLSQFCLSLRQTLVLWQN